MSSTLHNITISTNTIATVTATTITAIDYYETLLQHSVGALKKGEIVLTEAQKRAEAARKKAEFQAKAVETYQSR